MIKMIFMLKKRKGMATDEFIQRYETGHKLLGEKHVPNAVNYVRRFLNPASQLFWEGAQDFDVITELWFENQNELDKAMAHLARPEVANEIAEDEEELFDRSATRIYVVSEEHQSQK